MFGIKNKKPTGRNVDSKYQKQATFDYRSSVKQAGNLSERRGQSGKSEKMRWWISRLPYSISVLIFVVVTIQFLLVNPHAKVEVSGDTIYSRNMSQYQQAIDDKISSSFANRFRFSFNGQDLSNYIRQKFPEVQDVRVSLPIIRHRPIVEFRLALPAAIVSSGGEAYVVDGDGRALSNVGNKSSSLNIDKLPKVVDTTDTPISLGKPALTADQLHYIRQIYFQAEAKHVKVKSLEIQRGGDQLNVRFDEDNFLVKFSFHTDARLSFGTYYTVRQGISREGPSPTSYIDVRVPERAFVK